MPLNVQGGKAYPTWVNNQLNDELNSATIMIDVAHHEIHEGVSFHVGYYIANLGNGLNLDILLIVAGDSPHLVYRVAAGGDAVFYLYEGVAVDDNGTALAAYNLNRTSSNLSTVTSYHTPTNPAGGTILETRLLAGGTGPVQSSGDEARRNQEWILQTNTRYLLRINNISGVAQPVSIGISFYLL